MFSPNLLRRYLQALLIAALLGVVFGLITAARADAAPSPIAVSAPAPVPAPAVVATPKLQDDCEFGDECYLVVYVEGICDILRPWSYWWLVFYCDQRMSTVTSATYDYNHDGSVIVEVMAVDENGRRSSRVRYIPARKRR